MRDPSPPASPEPAGFQFQLKTLFLLTAVTAVVLVPARLLLADPVFRAAAAVYGVVLVTYLVLRGPFLYLRIRRLQRARLEIERKRQGILRQAQSQQQERRES